MTDEQQATMTEYDTLVHQLALIIARHQITKRRLDGSHHPAPGKFDLPSQRSEMDRIDIAIEERAAPSFYELARELIAKMDWPPERIAVLMNDRIEQAAPLPEHLRWKGDGPAPASWYAPDGTKVYRSYADYCED